MIECRALLFFVAMGTIAGLTACGGPGSSATLNETPQPNSVIFVATPPSSLAVNASATIYAAATYPIDGLTGNTLVTYSISCGSPNACGTLSASDEVGATVYTAPAAIPSGTTVTVTATSVANPSLTRSTTITIVPPIPISVSFFGAAPASLQVSASFALRALITNDVTANPQVKWTVACGGAVCGSFSPVTTGSEVATTYSAPAAIPPGNTVTVTATSVTDPTKSASTSIVITAPAPTLADGTYVFQISGSPGNTGTFITGTIVAKGGAITGGEQDATSDDGEGDEYMLFQQISGGSYSTTPDGNLEINVQVGANETETLNGTLASSFQGLIAGFDGVSGSGTLDPQTSKAAPTGGYAISLYGIDYYSSPTWLAGILNIDSPGGISGNGSVLDLIGGLIYSGGTPSLAASTVSAPDAFGRVVFQLNPGINSSLPALDLAGYIVDATHIRLNQFSDPAYSYVYSGISGGTALGQGENTGKFSPASVAGTSYVFAAQGEDMHGPLQIAGVVTLNTGGSATGTLNWNDLSGGAPQNPLAFTGAYTVDPTGRVTLTNLTDGATFKYSFHLYLTGNGSGLVLSSDANDIFAGQAFQQQAGAFSPASFNGGYGLNASLYNTTVFFGGPAWENPVGPLLAVPNAAADDVTGFADSGAGSADFAISGSFTAASNGVFEGTLAGFDVTLPTEANTFTLYVVDDTQAVAIETDNSQLTLGRLALVP
jgi:hypothetical protein